MDHLPIFLRVQDSETVVVGGGAVAARKAELLLRCGARVTLVAPALGRSAAALLARESGVSPGPTDPAGQLASATAGSSRAAGHIAHVAADFVPAHLDRAMLAIAATDSRETNAAVAGAARERRIPINVADDPALSSFILPAIVDRSPVVVAVGSQGTAPVLARRLREQLEALLPARLGALARFAGARRRVVQQALRPSDRRPFWERFFGGPASAQVLAGDEAAAESAFAGDLAAFRTRRPRLGEVYLIGAGPGDPDLLTLRALQLLQQADVVLHDRLVSQAVLDRARREAERVCVGKQAGGCRTAQERINELMLDYARRGLTVARLKGGDPFVFGRGGEEIRVLARHGIPVTVVPGVTAGLAAAAAAGIPLTQRRLAQSVTFATGHFADDDALDWQALARPGQTVVFYMGVAQLERIAGRLVEAGAPLSRPAALVERATLRDQRVLRAALGELTALARARSVAAPALLIIGEVAAADDGAAVESLTETLRGVA